MFPFRCRVCIFGSFRVESEAGLIRLPTHKVEALLAYLILHPEAHARDKLAALLWGDFTDAAARTSLRNAIAMLRKPLGKDLLLADREAVQLNPDYRLWVDEAEFQTGVRRLLDEQLPESEMASVLDLYRGDLLADFYDDWILSERDHYRALYLTTLLQLAQRARTKGDPGRAIGFAQRVLVHDPASEPAYQHLIAGCLAAGNPGAALRQYETCRRVLRDELGVEPLPETTALYQQAMQPSGPALDPERTNLPQPLTSFVGRTAEIAEVKQLLTTTRLLTLTGASGSGKTRLAIQGATDLVGAYADGVWWVDFGPLADPTLVPQALGKTLGVRERAGQPLRETLVSFLQPKHTLLVLDNCEHLLEACARLVEDLLGACPKLQALATSRETLGIAGEIAWRVPTLSLPDERRPIAPAELHQSECAQLFLERAKAVKPDFHFTRRNAAAVGQICRRLEGVPLAIELATARLNVLSVGQIAARLDDCFRLLTTGSRTALPRHQTLRAAMDWSYDLLSGEERALLQRLAVFAGGFTLEAAEAIGTDVPASTDTKGNGRVSTELHPGPSASPLDLLSQLVNKSLVIAELSGDGVRYRLLETIRQYAAEKLHAAGEAAQTRNRHLSCFLALAEAAEPELWQAEQGLWLDRLDLEHDNLRAALEWSRSEVSGPNLEAGLRLASALEYFWSVRGYWSEGRERMASLLAHPASNSYPAARAKALNRAGFLVAQQGDYAAGLALHEESLALSRQLGDRRETAYALQGPERVAESVALFRELGDQPGLARALGSLGALALLRFDVVAARPAYEESLAICRELGHRLGIAGSLYALSVIDRYIGNYSQARGRLEESLAIFQESRDQSGMALSLAGLGEVAGYQGDTTTARLRLQESLTIFKDLGDRGRIGMVFALLGRFTFYQGEYEQAAAYLEESLAVARALVSTRALAPIWAVGALLYFLGQVARRQGELERAVALFLEALDLAQKAEQPWSIGLALAGLAGVAATARQPERAARLLGAAQVLMESAQPSLAAPPERAEFDRTAAATRAQLSEAAFVDEWAAGRAMTLDQAVEYALASGQ